MTQRAWGLTTGGLAEQVLPQYQMTNGQIQVSYAQATNEPYLNVVVEQAGGLGAGSWQTLPLTNQTISCPPNLPTNVELRTLTIPIGTNAAQFFRTSVKSLLWEKQ
jgi:hypothetical protein